VFWRYFLRSQIPSFARALPPLLAPSAAPTSLSVTTQLVDHAIELGFEYWTAEQILRAALPPSIIEITSSFETIGHIAHMNLRDKQLPYKALIGQVCSPNNRAPAYLMGVDGGRGLVFGCATRFAQK